MNPDLDKLQPYPFTRLATLLRDVKAADVDKISLSIGEPKHEAPQFALDALSGSLRGVEVYPSTKGSPELRNAISQWLSQRFKLSGGISAEEQIIPVNGTREALFAIAQCMLDRSSNRRQVLMPNPFYQIYEGATLMAGLEPEFYNASANDAGDADFDSITEESWAATQMLYLCNPGNPTGSVIPEDKLKMLINLAEKHNFVIVSDECYSEIYREKSGAPVGLLQAASEMGNTDFKHCLVFHSLSKRSNLPGLRSGFVAGDAALLKSFLLYRTYHGCTMAPPVQLASQLAWEDEEHVIENRGAYDKKYKAVLEILSPVMNIREPAAGFYLWPTLPVDDETFTRDMRQLHNIDVVPGSYLGREINGHNPGSHRSRLALVAPLEPCIEAARRIYDYCSQQSH